MPQVFGSAEIGLIAESSLWLEADYLDDVKAHEDALGEAGFQGDNLPLNLDTSNFHPRGAVWGHFLRSEPGPQGNYTWAVARVANPEVNPNARQTDVGGAKPRYAVEIHSVPRNPDSPRARGAVTPLWEGNDIRHFLNGKGTGMGWPQVQKAMATGPRR